MAKEKVVTVYETKENTYHKAGEEIKIREDHALILVEKGYATETLPKPEKAAKV